MNKDEEQMQPERAANVENKIVKALHVLEAALWEPRDQIRLWESIRVRG